jgi:hypothetical protein
MPLTKVQSGMIGSVDATTLTGVVPAANGGTGTTAGVTGFKNRIINGDMTINQRAWSGNAVEFGYTLDRWITFTSGSNLWSVSQNAGSVTPPSGFPNYLGVTSLAATTVPVGGRNLVCQMIEGYNMADWNWGYSTAKTVTLSFWVRSSLTGTFGASINSTAQNTCATFSYTINAANTWEQKTITVTGPTTGSGEWDTTNGRGLWLFFDMGTGSDYALNTTWGSSAKYTIGSSRTNVIGTNGATWYLTGVQIEVGSSATNFDYLPYGTELQLCQRYFNIYRGGVYGGVQIVSSTFAFPLSVPVPMRTQPTFSTNMTDSRFAGATSPNSNQWAMYIQNSGWNTYSGSIDTLSLNGPAANSTQYNIGTYGVTLNSFTGFLLGGNIFFSFSAEL